MFGEKVKICKRSSNLKIKHKANYISLLYAFLKLNHALKEIQYYQTHTRLLIPCRPFARLVKQILFDNHMQIYKISTEELAAVQQVSELVIILFFELCNKAAIHGKRVTVMPHDAMFVKDFVRTVNHMNPIGYAKPLEAAQ